jgi:hypothetical protein
MEQMTGIEPAFSVWKTDVLTVGLHLQMVEMTGLEPATSCSQSRCAPSCATSRNWWFLWDLNPRPSGYEPDALPYCAKEPYIVETALHTQFPLKGVAGIAGFEPASESVTSLVGVKDRCLTAWRYPCIGGNQKR